MYFSQFMLPRFAMGHTCSARPHRHKQTWNGAAVEWSGGAEPFLSLPEDLSCCSVLWPRWDAPVLCAEPQRSLPSFSLFPWFISLSELTCCLMLPPTNPW